MALNHIRQASLPRRALQLLAFMVILALPAAGQDAASQIKAEADRLQQLLKDKPISVPGFGDLNSAVANALKATTEALSAGRLYLSLEQLNQATNLLHGARAAVDSAQAVKKGGLPAFESEWGKASLVLAALDQKAGERKWDNARAAIRALSERAQSQAKPLLDGSRGFATSTQPQDGLFNLGQAQGEAEFASFCASLNLPRQAAPYPLRSMLPELLSLQAKTNAAFQPPRSIELHPWFIALNSTLKLARELDASKFYAGSLYQYLEAVGQYGMLDAVAPDAPRQSGLKKAIAAMDKQLAASQRDDSIAQIFLERAESQVAHADGSVPSTDEWRSVQVTIEQVLPAFFAAQNPVSPREPASGKTIDMTLVRWPYT